MLDKKRMTTEEKLDRLSDVVNTLGSSVVAHDKQIEDLIKLGEENDRRLGLLSKEMRNLEKQWQAYIRTLRSK